MKIEPIGRRVAAYRKSAGFKTAEDLANAIPNAAVTKSTIQNVESGRKQDLSVSQLLDIAKALDIPPVALAVPINLPMEKAEIPGVGDAVASMTNLEVVRWFTMQNWSASDTGLNVWMRQVIQNINLLATAIEEFPAALAESRKKQDVVEYIAIAEDGTEYPSSYDPSQWSDQRLTDIALQAQTSYQALRNLTKGMDLSWADGPWLSLDTGSDDG